eukprot:1897646-Prymnesium_polylepis.1
MASTSISGSGSAATVAAVGGVAVLRLGIVAESCAPPDRRGLHRAHDDCKDYKPERRLALAPPGGSRAPQPTVNLR